MLAIVDIRLSIASLEVPVPAVEVVAGSFKRAMSEHKDDGGL